MKPTPREAKQIHEHYENSHAKFDCTICQKRHGIEYPCDHRISELESHLSEHLQTWIFDQDCTYEGTRALLKGLKKKDSLMHYESYVKQIMQNLSKYILMYELVLKMIEEHCQDCD